MYSNFKPTKRPFNAREKSIRFKYGLLFVIAAVFAITLGVLYKNQGDQLKEAIVIRNEIDSVIIKLDYPTYRIDNEEDTVDISYTEKINRLAEDASRYRDIHDDIFELRLTNTRYETALEYYADPLIHQEYRDRTRTNFKSKYTESQRKEIVEKIKKEAGSFNSIIAFKDAFDWYRGIDPVAIKEIEIFLFFTE